MNEKRLGFQRAEEPEERHLSRRRFLQLVSVGAVGLALAASETDKKSDPYLHVELDHNEEYSYEEREGVVLMLDSYYDKLPQTGVELDEENMLYYMAEILPHFEKQGIVHSAVLPRTFDHKHWLDDKKHFGIRGRANCMTGDMQLNGRYENPKSPWHDSDRQLTTLVHELTHIQGVCGGGTSAFVESSTQVITAEIMAALVNEGNKDFVRPLVGHLRTIALGATHYTAFKENRMDDFHTLLHNLRDSHAAESAWHLGDGENPTANDLYVLQAYYSIPFNRITEGLRDGKARGVMLPKNYRVNELQMMQKIDQQVLEIDDLAWFLRHIDRVVGEVQNEGITSTTN